MTGSWYGRSRARGCESRHLLARKLQHDIALAAHRSIIRSGAMPGVALLPAALEIVETPPSPTWRATAMIIVGFLAAALVWAAFDHMDIIAVAEGKLVPVGQGEGRPTA